ncbi:lysylphosphatidylglycerol synthase transmembrane domain-containing protein [Litchfieldella xinjiangensis]|uniref:lysylphosphatidylglycerol synthase transmembrane domain-containing protein n=1 Tax=Litchfieldella xinjiangensis TaxID=1166948 RepID=UPI000694F323|nr:lysylphosphatidylglycerol synthase transmembrane domain-containing protein [Halomonas xinjiangensis]
MSSLRMAERKARLSSWRPLHGVLFALSLVAPLGITLGLGGGDALKAVTHFPLGVLALMLALAVLCWNLNAARLRLMLDGRAGHLGQRGALTIEMASKFALCATPGGSGGPATLLLLLAQRGLSPAKGAGVFLVDQGCDLLFFMGMLTGLTLFSLFTEVTWPHQDLVQLALAGLALIAASLSVMILSLPWLLRRDPPPGMAKLAPRRRRWLARRLLSCRAALRTTLRLPTTTLLAMLLLTAAHWLLRYSLLYLAVLGAGGHADWVWSFLTQTLAMAASQLSILPGGAGAVEVGVGALLLPLMEREQAGVAVLVWRLVTYHFYLAAGAPFFLLTAYRVIRPSR